MTAPIDTTVEDWVKTWPKGLFVVAEGALIIRNVRGFYEWLNQQLTARAAVSIDAACASLDNQIVELVAKVAGNLEERVTLRVALEESVKLQSHYAELLNMWDGGHRIAFKDATAWLERLSELRLKEYETKTT